MVRDATALLSVVLIGVLVAIQGQVGRICPAGTYLDCSVACSQTYTEAICSCSTAGLEAFATSVAPGKSIEEAIAIAEKSTEKLAKSALMGAPSAIQTGIVCDDYCQQKKNLLTAYSCYDNGECSCLCGDNLASLCGCTANNGGTCVFCPAGKYSDNTTNLYNFQCVPCASGKISNVGSTSCTRCTPGLSVTVKQANGTALPPCNSAASRSLGTPQIQFVLAGLLMISLFFFIR